MNFYFQSKLCFRILSILLPWDSPICIPSLVLALIVGFPSLGAGLLLIIYLLFPTVPGFTSFIADLLPDDLSVLQLVVLYFVFAFIFLCPFVVTLRQTKIKFYRFSPYLDELRISHYWFRYPFRIYRRFSQPLQPIKSLSLLKDSTTVSGGPSTSGYTSTPIHLCWLYLICRDIDGETLAMLELANPAPPLFLRLAQFLDVEV